MNTLSLLPVNRYYSDVLELIYRLDNNIDNFFYHGELLHDFYSFRRSREIKKDKLLIPGIAVDATANDPMPVRRISSLLLIFIKFSIFSFQFFYKDNHLIYRFLDKGSGSI